MIFAVCFWGLMRSLRFNVDSIHNKCLQPLRELGHSYHIFVHTYNLTGSYSNKRNSEGPVKLNDTEWRLLYPDFVSIDNQDVFDASQNYSLYTSHGDPWRNQLNSLRNLIRSLYSLQRVGEMVHKLHYKYRYDGVIFLRPDVLYLNKLPVQYLVTPPPSLLLSQSQVPGGRVRGRHALFVPDFHRSCSGGEYNDRFAMGDVVSALVYSRRYSHALNFSRYHELHSESFTYEYLLSHPAGIAVVEIPFRFRRVRITGATHKRDFAVTSPEAQLQRRNRIFKRTPWIVRVLMNYRSDIDDPADLECSPNLRIFIDDSSSRLRRQTRLPVMLWSKGLRQRLGLLGSSNSSGRSNGSISDSAADSSGSRKGATREQERPHRVWYFIMITNLVTATCITTTYYIKRGVARILIIAVYMSSFYLIQRILFA